MSDREEEISAVWAEGEKCPTCRGPKQIQILKLADERSQKYFADLAAEARKPHFGEHEKQFTRALLLRAEEAGLYTPDKEQS